MQEVQGLVSVMIPCFNSARTLERALASLMAQSYTLWEALVIDDGSADDPKRVVDQFRDSRIHYYRFEENRGRAAARQKALELARGEYIGMLDADDWWLPAKLEKQVAVLAAHPGISLVSTGMYLVGQDGKALGKTGSACGVLSLRSPLKVPRPLPIAHAPTLVRAKVLQGRSYDTSLKVSEDLDFFLPVLLEHPYAHLSEPLYAYAFESNRQWTKVSAQLSAHRKIFSKYLRRYPTAAGFRILITYPKLAFYRLAFAVGLQKLLAERSVRPLESSDERALASLETAIATGAWRG